MTAIPDTPFAKLDADGRLLKPALKADPHVAGRFGFCGDISYDGPEDLISEVFVVSESGKPAIGFLAGSIKAYESLLFYSRKRVPIFRGVTSLQNIKRECGRHAAGRHYGRSWPS
ncbi:MAG: hypothetical protein FWD08_07350 [Alphaproteobacteria bacterium]|nr:hypothetical protein [Alphaproteobacteria bacterium]